MILTKLIWDRVQALVFFKKLPRFSKSNVQQPDVRTTALAYLVRKEDCVDVCVCVCVCYGGVLTNKIVGHTLGGIPPHEGADGNCSYPQLSSNCFYEGSSFGPPL